MLEVECGRIADGEQDEQYLAAGYHQLISNLFLRQQRTHAPVTWVERWRRSRRINPRGRLLPRRARIAKSQTSPKSQYSSLST